jgi:predicted Rossmann fold nucleotide-binding protein DprA/Smf involved in DNA uptake
VRVAWTGHRPELFERPDLARELVARETDRLLAEHGPRLAVLSGGQRGVDLWAASAALKRGVRLQLLLPAPPALLSTTWSADAAEALASAVGAAEQVTIFGSDPADPAGYDARNRALAASCDLLVAVWTGLERGGTFFTLTGARALGKPIREFRLVPSGYRPSPGERGI